MKSLVVGGTEGFGKSVAMALIENGYEVTTTGRSGGDYKVDVGNVLEWEEILTRIKLEQGPFDMVIFVAGYARAINPQSQTVDTWSEHKQKNVGYVEQALRQLVFVNNAKIVTLGSQWSYKTGSTQLKPYQDAKHALRELTEQYAAEHPNFSLVHICAPAMNTPQREKVWEFVTEKPEFKHGFEVADAHVIAQALVKEVIEHTHRGESLQINTYGEINSVLRLESDSEVLLRQMVQKRK